MRGWRRVLLLTLAGLGACGGEAHLRLAAAASLSEVLPPLMGRFEAAQGKRVEVVFGGSGALSTQARQGAPFDALLLAGLSEAARLEVIDGRFELLDAALIGNVLVLVALEDSTGQSTRKGEEPGSSSLRALWPTLAGKRVAIGADGVPAGDYARAWLARSGLEPGSAQLVPLEHVRAVLAAVQSGACDAGFVYASDLAGKAGLAAVVEDREPGQPPAVTYPFLRRGDLPASQAAEVEALLDFLRQSHAEFEASGFLGR